MRLPAGRLFAVVVPAAMLVAVPLAASCQTPEAYLQKLQDATGATYQSRQLVTYLTAPQSSAIIEVHSSPAGTFVRAESPNDVTRLWRDGGHGLLSGAHAAMEDLAPTSTRIDLNRILGKYDVAVGAAAQVIGVSVVPLELVRREDRRLVERLWLQPASGVVYRRELFDPKGHLIGLSEMLDMRWGQSDRAESYTGATPTMVERGPTADAPPILPYGYGLVSAYTIKTKDHPVTHWVYSDGLHALSVFRMRGTLRHPSGYRTVDLHGTRGWVGPGPGTWMWEGGRSVWTVVAEEPQLDPAVLTRSLPKGGPSVVERMGSWWARAFHLVRAAV